MPALIDVRRDARRILGVLLALLLLDCLFFAIFVYPKVKETTALRAEKDSFTSVLSDTKQHTEALGASLERVRAQEKGLESFYGEILGTKQAKMVEIEREISKIATEFRIDPREVRYDTEELPEGHVERFLIQLPLQGDYQNLRSFIERVERSQNFLVIDRVVLSGTKEGGVLLQLNVDVATYFNAPWLLKGSRSRRRAT